MENQNFDYSVNQNTDALLLNISSSKHFEQKFQDFVLDSKIAPLDLTFIIETLEIFQNFQPNIKQCARSLYSSELALQYGWQQSTAERHLYAIAYLAALEVAQ